MTEYISKQVQISKPDHLIFETLASFSNFTPIVADKVEEWTAEIDRCSFKTHGFTIRLKMEEREPHKTIKITGEDIPLDFAFWVQLQTVEEGDTRLRLTLRAELNVLMRTMLGSKLQTGMDQMAESIAKAFNAM